MKKIMKLLFFILIIFPNMLIAADSPLSLEIAFYPAPNGKVDQQWNIRNTSSTSIWLPFRVSHSEAQAYSFTHYGYKVKANGEWLEKRQRLDHRQYEVDWVELKPNETFSIFREQYPDKNIPWEEVNVWIWCRIGNVEREINISWKN